MLEIVTAYRATVGLVVGLLGLLSSARADGPCGPKPDCGPGVIGMVSKEPAIQADWSHSVANLFCCATGQGTPSSVPLSITASDCDTLSCAIIPLPGQGTAFDDGVSYGWTLIGAPGGQLSSTNQAGATFSATTPGLYFISVGVFDDGGPDGVDDPKLLSCQILVLAAGQTPPGGGDPPPGGGDPVPPVSGEPPGGWDPLPPPWGGLPIAPAPCAEPIWRPGPGIEATIYRNLTLCLQTEPGCPPRPAVSNLTLYGRDLDEWTCDDESGLQGDAVLFSLEDAGGGIVHLNGDGTGTFAATQPGFYRLRIKVDDGGTGARDDPAVFLSVSFTVMASCGCPQPPGWPPFPPLPPGTGPIVGPGPNPPPPPPPCSTYHWQPHTAIDAAVSPSSQTIYLLDEGFEPELASFTVTAEDLDLRGCPGQPETSQPVGDEMFATWAIIDGPTGFTPGADCWVDPSTYGANAGFAAIRPGTYTLEATVDDFARIGPADTGGRDDAPDVVTVTVTVKRPPGSAGDPGSGGYGSEAWFDVFRDAELSEHRGEVIGGTVYPVLYIKVARGDRVAGPETLTALATDLWPGYDPGMDTAEEWTIDLTTAGGWEQLGGDGEWQPAASAPYLAENATGASRVYRRRFATWDTTAQPLGNNGPHELSASQPVQFQTFAGGEWGPPGGSQPVAIERTVDNLLISDVHSNADLGEDRMPAFLLFDSDSGIIDHRTPPISFRLTDRGDPHVYMIRLHLRTTSDDPGTGFFSLIRDAAGAPLAFGAGATHTVFWDGRLDDGSLAPRGPYYFDLEAREYDATLPPEATSVGLLDVHTHKAIHYTTFESHDARVEYGEDSSWLAADYTLGDMHQRPPTEVRLCAVTPQLEVRYAPPPEPHPTALGTPHVGRMVYEFTEADEGGEYWVVFGGWDDSASWRRDHRVRGMMVLNARWRVPRASCYDILGDQTADDRAAHWLRLRGTYQAEALDGRSAGFILGCYYPTSDTTKPGRLPGDRVMYIHTHGLEPCGGRVQAAGERHIHAARSERELEGAFLSDFDLSACRLIIWHACHSADRSTEEGGVAHQAALQGAQCSVGWQGLLDGERAIVNHFTWYLFEGLMGDRLPVRVALAGAVQKMIDDPDILEHISPAGGGTCPSGSWDSDPYWGFSRYRIYGAGEPGATRIDRW